MRARLDQEPASGRRRERHRDLELWIIAAAGALVGLGPAAVEHVFPARVAFDVAGRGGERRAVGGFDDEVLRLPAGSAADRAGLLQCRQEIMRYERVIDVFLIYSLSFCGVCGIRRRVGAGIPLRCRHLADAAHRVDAQLRACSLVAGLQAGRCSLHVAHGTLLMAENLRKSSGRPSVPRVAARPASAPPR